MMRQQQHYIGLLLPNGCKRFQFMLHLIGHCEGQSVFPAHNGRNFGLNE